MTPSERHVRLESYCADEDVDAIVGVIQTAAHSGHAGDGSGRVLATKSYPSHDLDVGHGTPTMLEAFPRLFERVAAAALQDIARGPGEPGWALR